MKNFYLLSRFEVETALYQVLQSEDLWNENQQRKFPGSMHQEVDDILLRWTVPPQDGDLNVLSHYFDSLETSWQQVTRKLYHSVHLTLALVRFLGAKELGKVMLSRIKPGKGIGAHRDEGDYAKHFNRYHLVYQGGGKFHCGEESVEMKTGEFWIFNHHEEHWVENSSPQDRIHLIVDLKL